jgi:hypothetical protein
VPNTKRTQLLHGVWDARFRITENPRTVASGLATQIGRQLPAPARNVVGAAVFVVLARPHLHHGFADVQWVTSGRFDSRAVGNDRVEIFLRDGRSGELYAHGDAHLRMIEMPLRQRAAASELTAKQAAQLGKSQFLPILAARARQRDAEIALPN